MVFLHVFVCMYVALRGKCETSSILRRILNHFIKFCVKIPNCNCNVFLANRLIFRSETIYSVWNYNKENIVSVTETQTLIIGSGVSNTSFNEIVANLASS